MQDFLNRLFVASQYLAPQHLLSRLAGKVAGCRWPWLKNTLIRWFIDHYQVNMQEAAEPDPSRYSCFNDFFTRALAADARPIADDKTALVCPADGSISQLGDIHAGRLFQAKGQDFSLIELLGGDSELAAPFQKGRFATLYLSPRDYHRVHMPLDGKLKSMIYVPGDLFSVNTVTADQVPRLFARNERAVCIFDTPAGPMAMVLVGAMIVAGIETVWEGQVAPPPRTVQTRHYAGRRKPINLKKGQEMGRFKLGSTVILVFGADAVAWLDSYGPGSATRMGELLGHRLEAPASN